MKKQLLLLLSIFKLVTAVALLVFTILTGCTQNNESKQKDKEVVKKPLTAHEKIVVNNDPKSVKVDNGNATAVTNLSVDEFFKKINIATNDLNSYHVDFTLIRVQDQSSVNGDYIIQKDGITFLNERTINKVKTQNYGTKNKVYQKKDGQSWVLNEEPANKASNLYKKYIDYLQGIIDKKEKDKTKISLLETPYTYILEIIQDYDTSLKEHVIFNKSNFIFTELKEFTDIGTRTVKISKVNQIANIMTPEGINL